MLWAVWVLLCICWVWVLSNVVMRLLWYSGCFLDRYVQRVFCILFLFLALLCLCVISYSTSRSVFIGWLDCQSPFWRHDVLPIRWCPGCIWGLELIVCACYASLFCALTRSKVSCLTPAVFWCLMYLVLWSHALCCVIWHLEIRSLVIDLSNSVCKITLTTLLKF